jgi:hypothetical protein
MLKYKFYLNVHKLLYSYVLFINLLLKQLVPNIIFTWKAYILRYDFKVNSMCGTYT